MDKIASVAERFAIVAIIIIIIIVCLSTLQPSKRTKQKKRATGYKSRMVQNGHCHPRVLLLLYYDYVLM